MLVNDKSAYYRKQTPNGRFYFKDEIPYPSVTTIIGHKKNTGKSRGPGPSAHIGTIVHKKILGRYSKNVLPVSCNPIWNIPRNEVYGRINRCIQMWNNLHLSIQPFFVETSLFNKNPPYAGTLDMLAKIGCNNDLLDIHFEKELYILDLKSGLQYYDSHVAQAAAYWQALRRKPKVMFIYLDSIIDRNPEQLPVVKIFSQEELENGYDLFMDDYIDFEY